MTKQYELKQRAYASNLKSRALSILIYLVDRSNKELTCFPAIPTMARELHISVSTVKRALHELVAAGFVAKESRFRENNRGQTSNLYTLQFSDCTPNNDNDSNQPKADEIENIPCELTVYAAEQITFETIAGEEAAELPAHEDISTPIKEHGNATDTPVHLANAAVKLQKNIIPACRSVIEKAAPFFKWTGAGFNLIPP